MKFYLLLIVALLPSFLFSQTVVGKVKSSDKEIDFATVLLKTLKDELVVKSSTNDKGVFQFTALEGNYILIIKRNGYKEYQSAITISRDYDLGTIAIEPESIELNNVVLQSKKHVLVRKNDRLIFNIENTTASDAGTALDVLGLTPGLVLNDDKLTMLGKNTLQVMIDGRIRILSSEQLTSYLNSIPSSTIKSIEVISSPPSKYSAEGNGGLINIITKQSPNDSWNSTVRFSATQRFKSSFDGDATFNYRKDKISIAANAGGGNFIKNNIFENSTFYPDQTWKGDGKILYQNKDLNANLFIDYQVSRSWKTGINYINSSARFTEKSHNSDVVFDAGGGLDSSIISAGLAGGAPKRNSINLHNIFELDSIGKKISFDIDYYNADSGKNADRSGNVYDQNNELVEGSYFANESSIDYNFNNVSVKIDTELPLKAVDLEFGANSSFSRTKNQFYFFDESTGEPVFDPFQSNRFRYDEKIFSVYASADKNLTEKWSLKAGMRMEQTWTDSYSESGNEANAGDYLSFFPTLFATYKINKSYSLNFSMDRRLERPRFEALDPFRIIVNPYKIISGNPFLRPSYTYNYEIIFNSKKNEIKSYLQDLRGGYSQIGEIDPSTKVKYYNYYNHLDVISFGITDTYIYDKLKWLTSYNTFDIGYSKMTSSIPETVGRLEGYNAFIQTKNDMNLNKDNTLIAGFGFYYVFPAKANLAESDGYSSMSLSLKAKLLDKKLNLSFFATDLFYGNRHLVSSYYNGIKTSYNNYFDSRSFKVTATYSFGNKKINVRSRKPANQEVQNRS